MALLDVQNLATWFHTRDGIVRAVDGVSFHVAPGETLGIVGESGSGKSVACMSLLGLIPCPPGRIESGRALFDGKDLLAMRPEPLRAIRGRRITMVFQDPMTSLNPYMTIGSQIMEPLRAHERCSKREARDRAVEALRLVGISNAADSLSSYPHEYSGGMRQRVMIAMALITRPALLIADEPTTALDVTVQAQILDLIKGLQGELGMAVILITHDLGIVAGRCDRVAVMYVGRILESAPTPELFAQPRHPYTRALMAALPAVSARGHDLYSIPGMPPDPAEPMPGCPFAPRCPHAVDKCRAGDVALAELAPGHATACIREQAGEL